MDSFYSECIKRRMKLGFVAFMLFNNHHIVRYIHKYIMIYNNNNNIIPSDLRQDIYLSMHKNNAFAPIDSKDERIKDVFRDVAVLCRQNRKQKLLLYDHLLPLHYDFYPSEDSFFSSVHQRIMNDPEWTESEKSLYLDLSFAPNDLLSIMMKYQISFSQLQKFKKKIKRSCKK